MAASKSPSRVTNGPYAAWETSDAMCEFVFAANATIKIGQPVCIDVTQLGPDQNVPNNAAALAQCERVVATTSGNAGDIFGIVVGVQSPAQVSPTLAVTLSYVNGVPTYTNSTGASIVQTLIVRQVGFGYVFAGTAAVGQTGGNSILVGSRLITTSAQAFAIQGTQAAGKTVGLAIATAINTTRIGNAPGTTGVISLIPNSIVGLVPGAIVNIDVLGSGVQEAVSVGAISYPTVSIALANAHGAGFKITGPNSNPLINSVLISTPGSGATAQGLVATWINVFA